MYKNSFSRLRRPYYINPPIYPTVGGYFFYFGTGYYGHILIAKNNLDPEKQAVCLQNNWVALDPKTGARLRRSLDVQPNDQIEYFLYIPHFLSRVIWAKTDEEAMSIANNGWN